MADDVEVKKQMDELVELNKQLLAQNEELKKSNAQLQKDVDELLEKAEDGAECKMEDGSPGVMKMGKCVAKVDKAAVPESVQKALDEQAAIIKKQADDIAKMREKEDLREWVTKAAAFSNLPIKAEELGPILKSAAGVMSPEQFKELDRVLKAGDAACKELTKMTGNRGNGGEETAYDKLSGLAKQEQAKGGITFEKAFAKVSKENPELMRQHSEEQRALRQH